MLRDAGGFRGSTILAEDGPIGQVVDLFIDDRGWAVRYLVVDTGGWLTGRRVLISPQSVDEVDWEAGRIRVGLTREQVRSSPEVDAHMPVSRQKEIELSRHFNWPYYWGGVGMWGGGAIVPLTGGAEGLEIGLDGDAPDAAPSEEDRHLLSLVDLKSYRALAEDGELGELDTLVVDDADWAVRYLRIDASSWRSGGPVLLSPAWITRVSWEDRSLQAALVQELVRQAPEYDGQMPVSREYESRLHEHYGLRRYWEPERAA